MIRNLTIAALFVSVCLALFVTGFLCILCAFAVKFEPQRTQGNAKYHNVRLDH